jgi:hypothetical protein
MKKLLIIAAAIAFMPSVALADGGECDGGAGANPRCFNAARGNPFYVQSNQAGVTGSIGNQPSQSGVTGSTASQPASVDRAPAARRQARHRPSNQQAVSGSTSSRAAAVARMPAAQRQMRNQPSSQADITGSIGSPPSALGQTPTARRQTYSDGRPSSSQ